MLRGFHNTVESRKLKARSIRELALCKWVEYIISFDIHVDRMMKTWVINIHRAEGERELELREIERNRERKEEEKQKD